MKRIAFIICLLLLPFGALFGAEIRVGAQVETDNPIYAGVRFGYHIILQGTNQAGDVDLSPLSEYSPVLVGRKASTRLDRQTRRPVKYFIMTYSLLVSKAGTLDLPGVKVTASGKSFKTKPVRVAVVEPSKSDKLALEVSVSKAKCFVGEPVEISLKWYVTKGIVANREVDGISVLSPVFDSSAFYIERIINEPKALRDQKNYARLQLNSKNVPFSQRQVKRKGKDWVVLSYSAVFIPKHAGNITIEPSRVLCDLVVGVVRDVYGRKQYETKRFMAESKVASLEVVPLPDVARPKEAYGLVGNYTIAASATPTSVDVGQPITLTVMVGGSKLLSPVRWPDLEKMEGFADDFKISTQRADPVVTGGQKIFTIIIRAANDSITEIPSIPLVFFDAGKGKFVTAKSKAIPLKVSHSDVVTISDAERSGKGTINSQVEAVKKGMSANVGDIKLVSQDFSPVAAMVSLGYLSLWGLPFAAFVVSAIVRLLTHTSDAKVAASRRRGARKNAETMVRAASSKQDVAAAMREYVGWRFAKSSGALTGMDCERVIADVTGDAEVAKEYRVMFQACEASRYTGGSGTFDGGDIDKVISLIVLIDKKS